MSKTTVKEVIEWCETFGIGHYKHGRTFKAAYNTGDGILSTSISVIRLNKMTLVEAQEFIRGGCL